MKPRSWGVYAVLGACTLLSALQLPMRPDAQSREMIKASTDDLPPERNLDAELDEQVQWLHDALRRQNSAGTEDSRPGPDRQSGQSDAARHLRREI